MEKSDIYEMRIQLEGFRCYARNWLAEFLKDTDEDHPYECDIPVGDWHAMSVSSLLLMHITGLYLDKKYNSIWMRWEGDDEFSADFDDLPADEIVELLEGLQ